MRAVECEPLKENEFWCAYCGYGWRADWDLVTDEGEIVVCDNHHFILREIRAVALERKIGDTEWNEVPNFKMNGFSDEYLEDLGDWKGLIDRN